EDALCAAVLVEFAVFRVFGHQQFVIDAFGGDEHERVVESVLVGKNIFFGDRIGVFADGLPEFPAGILGSVHQFAVGVEGEFGINREDAVAAAHNCVDDCAGGSESKLRFVGAA